MISRARKADIPFAWVAGDEAYGGDPRLRTRLQEDGIPYVMAACSDIIAMAVGEMRADEGRRPGPKDGLQRLSCADGSKSPRL